MLQFTTDELDFIEMLCLDYNHNLLDNADRNTDVDFVIDHLTASRDIIRKISPIVDKEPEQAEPEQE